MIDNVLACPAGHADNHIEPASALPAPGRALCSRGRDRW